MPLEKDNNAINEVKSDEKADKGGYDSNGDEDNDNSHQDNCYGASKIQQYL